MANDQRSDRLQIVGYGFLVLLIIALLAFLVWFFFLRENAGEAPTQKATTQATTTTTTVAPVEPVKQTPPQPGRKKTFAVDTQDAQGNPFSFDAVLTDESVEDASARRLNAADRILGLEDREKEAQKRVQNLEDEAKALAKKLNRAKKESSEALKKVREEFARGLSNEAKERKKLETSHLTQLQDHEGRIEALEQAPKCPPPVEVIPPRASMPKPIQKQVYCP